MLPFQMAWFNCEVLSADLSGRIIKGREKWEGGGPLCHVRSTQQSYSLPIRPNGEFIYNEIKCLTLSMKFSVALVYDHKHTFNAL